MGIGELIQNIFHLFDLKRDFLKIVRKLLRVLAIGVLPVFKVVYTLA